MIPWGFFSGQTHVVIHFYTKYTFLNCYPFVCIFYLIYLSRVPRKSSTSLGIYKELPFAQSLMPYNLQRFSGKVSNALLTSYNLSPFSRESLPRRTERDWGDFSKRIHFKVCGFMQEATVGAKDFSICRIRGWQHVHHRYRAEIEWICIPFIRIARSSLPAEGGRRSWLPRHRNQGAWFWMQIIKAPDVCPKRNMIRNHVKIQGEEFKKIFRIS